MMNANYLYMVNPSTYTVRPFQIYMKKGSRLNCIFQKYEKTKLFNRTKSDTKFKLMELFLKNIFYETMCGSR